MALGLGIGTRRLRDRNPQSATPAPAPPTESFGFAAALWRTRRYLLPELRHFLIFAALSGVAMLLQLAASLVGFDLLTNKVFLGEPLTALQARLLGLDAAEFVTVEELGQGARLTLRTAFLLLTGVLLALGFVLGNGLGYYLTWILQRVNQHLRLAMMDSAVHLSLRRSDSRQVGDAIYRVYQDSAMVTSVVRNALVAPAVAFFNLLVAVGAVSFFSLYLGMLFLVAAAPALLLAWAFTPRLRTLSGKARAANSELTSHIQESVGGVRLLKACRAEMGALEGFRSRSTTALDRAYELRRAIALLGLLVYLCAALAALAADYLMVRWVWTEAPTFGYGLVAFIGFAVWNLGAFQAAQERLSAISGTGVSLAATWCVLQDMSVGLKRAFFLLDAEPEVVDKPDALPMPALGEGVRFEGVRFGYAADRPVLDGATFHAQPGTTVAIVGPSGAGKSTLLSLLLRLYEVDGGGVRVGGVDVRDIRVRDLRAAIAIVLQENALFPTSIADNIRYAAPSATDQEVEQAARTACADEFVEALPAGYATELGERGAKLSAGQRQRLSIARAVAKDAPILILDEPTAALDVATEQRVLERLAAHGKEKVIFLVTHRIGTIRRADQILFLENGRIVERGRHDELMAIADGRYAHFVQSEVELAS